LKLIWCRKPKIDLTPKKLAILISCDYLYDSQYKLNSSTNDINNITNLLITQFNYKNEYIYVLKNYKKKNIIDFFKFILKIINPEDNIFFYFTGHGTDNALVTEDSKLLYNFEIRNSFINRLKKNVKLFGLIDACHSENEFNLQYYYLNFNWFKNIKYNKPLCNVMMISACMKNEITWTIFNTSFITNLFTSIIMKNNNITWDELILKINYNIIENGYKQTPILSSSEIINIKNSVSSFI
jgi:hypothetical protein